MDKTAEEFLREKLESEVAAFGDGTTEFHTRDLEFLLKCLDEKDKKINSLTKRLNVDAESAILEAFDRLEAGKFARKQKSKDKKGE